MTHYTVADDLNESLASEAANITKMTTGIPQITFGVTISQCITELTSYSSLIAQILQANDSVCRSCNFSHYKFVKCHLIL